IAGKNSRIAVAGLSRRLIDIEQMPVKGSNIRRLTREFNRQMQPKARVHLTSLLSRDFRKNFGSVTKQRRNRSDRIPDHVAEATQSHKVVGDFVPARLSPKTRRRPNLFERLRTP